LLTLSQNRTRASLWSSPGELLSLLMQDSSSLTKAQEEVDRVLQGRRPTYEDMKDLKFLNRCIIESLRLYPHPPVGYLQQFTAWMSFWVWKYCLLSFVYERSKLMYRLCLIGKTSDMTNSFIFYFLNFESNICWYNDPDCWNFWNPVVSENYSFFIFFDYTCYYLHWNYWFCLGETYHRPKRQTTIVDLTP